MKLVPAHCSPEVWEQRKRLRSFLDNLQYLIGFDEPFVADLIKQVAYRRAWIEERESNRKQRPKAG